MSRWMPSAAALILIVTTGAHADPVPEKSEKKAPDPAAALSALGGTSTDGLAGSLRGYLVRSLPKPLYQDASHWGMQTECFDGIKWRGKGLDIHAEKQTELKNDGEWWRVLVRADNLADTLIFDIREMTQPEPGRMLFTAFVSFDTEVNYDRQHWRKGVRTWSGSVNAKLRVKLKLDVEVNTRFEGTGLLQDMVFRMRVTKAEMKYDNLKVTHVAGIGGEAAELMGEAFTGSMRQWHPSFERDLLTRADAAIVKAADTKEVRVGLGALLKKKK